MTPRVNFIGLGAQKCASTWVHHVLAQHPQASLSSPKEIDYFSYFYGRGHDWYERHFSPGPGAVAVGDNSPSYFVHPLAPARAVRYNPALKIVLALRDPVERAYSNHLHMVREGYLTGPNLSFEYGMERNEMYVDQSRYATHLRAWLNHFRRERIFVLFQEDLAIDGERITAELYRFLGLDASFRPADSGRRANESAIPVNVRTDSILKRGASLARRAGLGRWVGALKSSQAGRRMWEKNRLSLREIIPPMKAETRARLCRELGPEVADLRVLIDRPTLPWPQFNDDRLREPLTAPASFDDPVAARAR